MDEIKIVTDNKPRELKCFMDLSERERADFDYIKDADFYSQRFVRYKGHWYDVNDTQLITTEPYRMGWDMPVAKDHILAKWDAILWDTFFSAMVYKFSEDWESVIVGVYYA